MKWLNKVCPNDPHGYCKHRVGGWILICLVLLMWFEWGAALIGIFGLFLFAKTWEWARKELFGSETSMADVWHTMIGGCIGVAMMIVVKIGFIMLSIEFKGFWYLVFG